MNHFAANNERAETERLLAWARKNVVEFRDGDWNRCDYAEGIRGLASLAALFHDRLTRLEQWAAEKEEA